VTRALGAALTALWTAAAAASGAQAASVSVELSAWRPAQGEPVFVAAAFSPPAESVTVLWKGIAVPAWPDGGGRYRAVVGVDLLDPPGPARLEVVEEGAAAPRRVVLDLEVVERAYPVQAVRVPAEMAEFDQITLARIAEERGRIERLLARVSPPLGWSLPFAEPVAGSSLSGFGARRLVNGQPREVHAGADIPAPEGTPVAAAERGTVVFAGTQFFGGNSVVIDHGGGLFTVYYHLKEAVVAEGEPVARGQRIGSVGATGRATGPHLHFGVRAAGGRVDPAFFLPPAAGPGR